MDATIVIFISKLFLYLRTNDNVSSECFSFKFVILSRFLEKREGFHSHIIPEYGFVPPKFRSVELKLINYSPMLHDQIS